MYLMIDNQCMNCNSTLTIDVPMYAYLFNQPVRSSPSLLEGGAQLCNIYDVMNEILGHSFSSNSPRAVAGQMGPDTMLPLLGTLSRRQSYPF